MTPGKLFILIGSGLVLIGLILTFAPSLFGWFGRLPGDIRIKDKHRSFFFPITSMIVVSLGGCPRIAIVARARLIESDFSII